MNEITKKDFLCNAEQILNDVLTDDELVKVATPHGKAVIISETEWNICREALKVLLQQP